MNKKLATLLVPLMLIAVAGFGYAQFNASAYIYNTGNTGTVSVEWVGDGAWIARHLLYVTDALGVIATRDATDTFKAYVTVNNLYPGAELILGLALKNTGSLPMRLKSMRIDLTSDPAYLRNVLYFAIPGVDSSGSQDTWANPDHSYPKNPYAGLYVLNTLNAWDGYTHNFAPGQVAVVQPGHWYAVYGFSRMDPAAGNAFQDKTITFTITVTVEQAVP